MADNIVENKKKICQLIRRKKNIIIIFFPFRFVNLNRSYLDGESEILNKFVTTFFVTKIFNPFQTNGTVSLFNSNEMDCETTPYSFSKDRICVELNKNVLYLKSIKIRGDLKNFNNFRVIWIFYNFNEFSKCEVLSSGSYSDYNCGNYFKYLKKKINENVNERKTKKASYIIISQIKSNFLRVLITIILQLSYYSRKCLPVTKYFSIAEHFKCYLDGLVWVIKCYEEKKELDIKVINYLLSVLLDMFLGILFLQCLNYKISLDTFPSLFLFTAESIVNSIKDLISWLRGDPAGLKLNWAFNNVLATFFSFHIDIWWTFLVYLKPIVKIIAQVFFKFGVLGITFQASLIADLLTLVSFHVYCIYAYATKLYGIQISSLISLWRLFLGRKKNPLRDKVDSCRYTPEQLFVGTLGFTILLFLLPTTFLYYTVFSSIRLLLLCIGTGLRLIRYYFVTLPIYSTLLWMMKSSKISAEIKIKSYKPHLKSNFNLLKVKPVAYSWWKTIILFKPDFITKPANVKMTNFLSSLMTGELINPI